MKRIKHCLTRRRTELFCLYTSAFILTSVIVYLYFILTKKTLISNDGIRQHYVAFVYFGKYVRNIARTLVTAHRLVIPQYSFSIGYGGDILQTMNYYVVGDPLNILSVITPSRYAYIAYDFLSVFRLYLAGAAFILFTRAQGVASRLSLVCGAIMYCFCGYAFNFAASHPFFCKSHDLSSAASFRRTKGY